MAKKTKAIAEQVQDQINSSSRDLGKVKTRHAQGLFSNEPDDSVEAGSDNIIWKIQSFSDTMGRCVNYSATVSGFERGLNCGWCIHSMLDDTDTLTAEAARFNWLRAGGCSEGKFSTDLGADFTCSGYEWAKHFVPHPKTFRKTYESVSIDHATSLYGEISRSAVTSGFVSMMSTEIMKQNTGTVRLNISSADSVGVFVSGHRKYTSRSLANQTRYVDVDLVGGEFTRVDVTYYSPEDGGRYSIGQDLGYSVDSWRTPQTLDFPEAFYATYAYKPPGSVAKASYILGYFTPPDDDTMSQVEVEWRAPNFRPNWQRLLVDVDTDDPTIQISGVWRVPHTQEIEARARSINGWGDPGAWHTISGLTSAAGNQKPSHLDGPMVDYTVSRGIGEFSFDVNVRYEEDWMQFILVSGYDHDHYVESNSLFSGASAGDTSLVLASSPTIMTSGMLLTIDGGYESDTDGELHIIQHADSSSSTIILKEPIAVGIVGNPTVKAYNVAKVSSETEFSLVSEESTMRFFNLVGKTYNGAISAFADAIDDWGMMSTPVTRQGSQLLGPNLIRNGSLESPNYVDLPAEANLRDNPLNWWFVTDGESGAPDGQMPRIVDYGAKHGSQAAVFFINPGDGNGGEDNQLQQDVYGAAWNTDYMFSAWRFCFDNAGSSFTSTSGVSRWKYEVWAYDKDETLGTDFQYQDLPPSVEFLYSGHYVDLLEKGPYGAGSPQWLEENRVVELVTVSGSAGDVVGKLPLVRIAMWNTDESLQSDWPDYDAGDLFSPSIFVDQISFSSADPMEHRDDAAVFGQSINWPTWRLNQGVDGTQQGDHLHIDRLYGLNTLRREGNPAPPDNAADTSLAGYTVSGALNFPRLIYWAPNVVTSDGTAPSYYLTAPDFEGATIMNYGQLIVPSGKAIWFDVTPKETYKYQSDEVAHGNSVFPGGHRFIFPSGGHLMQNGEHFDPGMHGWHQTVQINVIRSDGGPNLTANYEPICALDSDLQIGRITVYAYSGPLQPGIREFWHTCDVKIWETDIPFVASGVNVTHPYMSHIGYVNRQGLTSLTPTETGTSRG